jgi:hypothetical protein
LHGKLTTDQISALKKKLPKLFTGASYYREQFRTNYEEKLRNFKALEELSFEQKEEKRRICFEIVENLKKEK